MTHLSQDLNIALLKWNFLLSGSKNFHCVQPSYFITAVGDNWQTTAKSVFPAKWSQVFIT